MLFPNTPGVISKETVGNSWDILNAILGHKHHQNQTGSYRANEANICNKSDLITVCRRVSLHDRLFCHQNSGSVHGYFRPPRSVLQGLSSCQLCTQLRPTYLLNRMTRVASCSLPSVSVSLVTTLPHRPH